MKNNTAKDTFEENEECGLDIVDRKRLRMEEPSQYGLTEKNNEKDAEMLDTQSSGIVLSKNELLAGAATQPCQSP